MQASRREALDRDAHAGVARHDGNGSTAATARGGAERWQNRAEKKRRGRQRLRLKRVARKLKEATTKPLPRQCDAKDGHDAPGTPKKVAGHVATAVNTVHSIYKFAIRQNSQITLKFS